MPDLTLKSVKDYCHITNDKEDDDVLDLIDTAKEYLAGAGVPASAIGTGRYNLAVKSLTLHWHDNKGVSSDNKTEIPIGFSSILIQLQNSE